MVFIPSLQWKNALGFVEIPKEYTSHEVFCANGFLVGNFSDIDYKSTPLVRMVGNLVNIEVHEARVATTSRHFQEPILCL